MKPTIRWTTKFIVILCGWAAAANAQNTAEIRGRIEDSTHRPIGSAFVIVTFNDTSVMRAASSDDAGEFTVPALVVGTYTVQVTSEGFGAVTLNGVRASIGQVTRLEIVLARESNEAKALSQSSDSIVESGNAQLGVVMSGEQISELPLKSRDTFELLQLQPGVESTIGTNVFFGSDRPGVVSVSGARTRSNNYNVNGGYSAEQLVNSPSIQPSPDSISEFRVISHNYDAALGRNSGSVLDVVTKSGSSRLHGSVYAFLRNNDLNSKGYFDPKVPDFKQNEFGATVGGPLRRDKTFFFVSYEGRRQVRGITSDPVTVPTKAERNGDFSTGPPFTGMLSDKIVARTLVDRPGCADAILARGGVISAGIPYAQVFPGNVVPPECFDPTAADLMAQFVPVGNSGPSQFTSSPNARVRADQITLRVDHSPKSNQQMSLYYYGSDSYDDEPFSYFLGLGANLPGFGTITRPRYQQLNVSHSWNISARQVNEARLVYYREGEGNLLSPANTNLVQDSCKQVPTTNCFNDPTRPGLGIVPGYGAKYEGVPLVSLAGSFAFGNNSNGSFSQTGNVYEAADTYTWMTGAHTFKFGAGARNERLHQLYLYDLSGGFQFFGGGPNDVGYTSVLPNYLLGLPDNFSEGSASAVDARTTQLDGFVQDAWKLRRNLMLNYGLRWEFSTPYADAGNRIQAFRPGQATSVYPCMLGASDPLQALTASQDCSPSGPAGSIFPLGMVFPGDRDVPTGLTSEYAHAFAPRLGLVWSPDWQQGPLAAITGGPGHTSLRLGWGMFYDSNEEMMFGENLAAQPPFGGATYIHNSFLDLPFLEQNGVVIPNPFHGFLDPKPGTPVDFALFRPITLYGNLPPSFRTPYQAHYNATVQRELSSSTLLQFGYVGSQGHRLTASIDQNYGNPQTCLDLNQIPGMNCGPFGADNKYVIAPGAIPAGVTVHLPYGSVPSFTGPNTNPITMVGLRRYSSPSCEPTTGVGCPPDGVPVFASIFANLPIANSSYNSLQALVSHRFSHGFDLLASYTRSKSIDNASSFENAVNPIDPARSRSLSLYDARHRLVLSGYWQLPGPGHASWARAAWGGWAVSGILTAQSGFPIRMSSASDHELMNSLNFEPFGEPEQVAPFRRLRPQASGGYYFDPHSFKESPMGQIGNTPRNLCCGPGIANLDLGVHKTVQIKEAAKLEFRTEIFNVMNHTQFLNPDGNITDDSKFGTVTAARDPRLVQFALRLTF